MTDSSDSAELMRTLAHRLRSPVGGILDLSNLILFGTEGEVSADALEDIQQIHALATRLMETIDGIVDVARIWSETDPMAPTGINSMTRDVVETEAIVELARAQNRRVVNRAPENLPEVWGNGRRIWITLVGILRAMIRISQQEAIDLLASVDGQFVVFEISEGADEFENGAAPLSLDAFLHQRAGASQVALDILLATQAAQRHQGRFWLTGLPDFSRIRMHLSLPLAGSQENRGHRANQRQNSRKTKQ